MLKNYLDKIAAGEDLTREEAAVALEKVISEDLSATEIGGLLVGLRVKGESIAEISGFIDTMERHMIQVRLDDPEAMDVCGTGGDGSNSFNVSTTVALVVAAGGVTVAKHGNRSVSSKSGSADLLEKLGIKIDLEQKQVKECADSIGIGFFFAPRFHPAMKVVVPHRRNLGIRTVFNMLGPLLNPARVRRQLIGVYDLPTAEKMAGVIQQRAYSKACVVHSADGFDELSPFASNYLYEVNQHTENPFSFKYQFKNNISTTQKMIEGSDAANNAQITLNVLKGRKGAARDMTLLNAACAFYVADKVKSIDDGLAFATQVIDSGAALKKVGQFREISCDLAA